LIPAIFSATLELARVSKVGGVGGLMLDGDIGGDDRAATGRTMVIIWRGSID
jgi:hypothetical protein